MTADELREKVARAYAAAWKTDIQEQLGEVVPSWDEMTEPMRDAMRRCAVEPSRIAREQTIRECAAIAASLAPLKPERDTATKIEAAILALLEKPHAPAK